MISENDLGGRMKVTSGADMTLNRDDTVELMEGRLGGCYAPSVGGIERYHDQRLSVCPSLRSAAAHKL